jgi:hypothetical protein
MYSLARLQFTVTRVRQSLRNPESACSQIDKRGQVVANCLLIEVRLLEVSVKVELRLVKVGENRAKKGVRE